MKDRLQFDETNTATCNAKMLGGQIAITSEGREGRNAQNKV